jgi:hypothetical protein
MSLKYQGHVFDTAQCSCCIGDARKVMVDPTQTGRLRAQLRGTMALRWRKMRLLAREIIVEHDILGLKSGGLMQIASPTILNAGTKLQSFQRWWEMALDSSVLGGDGSVMRPFIHAAYEKGVSYAHGALKKYILSGIAQHREEALFQLAVIELQGIMAAVSQQATRVVTQGMLVQQTPMTIVRNIWAVIDRVGINRTNAMIELLVVRAHAEATLDIFEAAKIRAVGLVPEARAGLNDNLRDQMLDAKKGKGRGGKKGAGSRISRKAPPSKRTVQRIRRQELALAKRLGERVRVRTAGDDDVCPICEAISEEGPYPIDQARSLIPAHPHCRCTFVPADDARFASDQMFMFDDESGAFTCDADEIAPAMVECLARMNARLSTGDTFNPNQSRDPDGKWTSESVAAALPKTYSGKHAHEYYKPTVVDNPIPLSKAVSRDDFNSMPKSIFGNVRGLPREEVKISALTSVQDYISPTRVHNYLQPASEQPYGLTTTIPVAVVHIGKETVIIDGTHRVVAAKLSGEKTLEVLNLGRWSIKGGVWTKKVSDALDMNTNHDPHTGEFASGASTEEAVARLNKLPEVLPHERHFDPSFGGEDFGPEVHVTTVGFERTPIPHILKEGEAGVKRDVDLKSIIVHQASVTKGLVEKYIRNAPSELVHIIKVGGKHYAASGTHRLVAAKIRGAKTISAIVHERTK